VSQFYPFFKAEFSWSKLTSTSPFFKGITVY